MPGGHRTALRRARVVADLDNPLQIGASGTASHELDAFPGDVSLTRYMELPVEQYFVLDPSQITFLGGDRFLLLVPRINILNVWVEPVVEVSVTIHRGVNPYVRLKAENARIRGSDLIENLKLDQRFVLQFQTELTWTDPDAPADFSGRTAGSGQLSGGGGGSDGLGTGSDSGSASKTSSSSGGGGISGSYDASDVTSGSHAPALQSTVPQRLVGRGKIFGAAQLDVWSEVVPPFNLMPPSALQATCNLVLRGLVGSLLPLFVRKLSEDYMKWAQDPAYRVQRALRSSPLA